MRAVRLLDFFTTHPGRGFTLSDLSRQLRLSKSVTHVIATTLADAALLVQNPATHEYRLGPALVPMGDVADRGFAALMHAKDEATRLAEEYESEVLITAATKEELLILGHAGVPLPHSVMWREGQRHPLLPPVGALHMAWSSPATVEAWLARLGASLAESEREHHRLGLSAVRRRGFLIGLLVPAIYDIYGLYSNDRVYTEEGWREVSSAIAALAHDPRHLPVDDSELGEDEQLAAIQAPVFGPEGSLLFAINLVPDAQYRVRDIPVLSRAVLRAAGRVMATNDGRHPAGTDQPSVGVSADAADPDADVPLLGSLPDRS
jgi:DNA-binding IclR family transcriptional regulator